MADQNLTQGELFREGAVPVPTRTVQRTITILLPDDPDLRATMEAFRKVRQEASPTCFNSGEPLNYFDLHREAYRCVKGQVSAQMTLSALRSVAGAYQSAASNKRPATAPFIFCKLLAIFAIGARGRDAAFKQDGALSVWTVTGRKRIAYEVPAAFQQRFADAVEYDQLTVVERNGRLVGRLVLTLAVPARTGSRPVGIDLNETNALVAVDSDDRMLFVSGKEVKVRNKKTYKTRKRLQAKLSARKAQKRDTRSVRRALKRLGRKQRNRTLDFCRKTACKLAAWLPEDAALAWEKLQIPQPKKGEIGGKALRRRLSLWQRRLLRQACSDKVALMGIPEEEVSARYTSKNCSRCKKRGVRKRHDFHCNKCGYKEHADVNAARNVRDRSHFTVAQTTVGHPSIDPEALTI